MEGSVAAGIKRIISAKAMVQGAVAKRSGFTPQQFSDMLNGRKIIKAEYIPPIAKALSVDVADIFVAGEAKQHGA